MWEWVKESHGTITGQMRKLGESVDWSRERFTLDPGLSRAVRREFVSLYREGLIYRDNYIVNWCPRCRTALSDLEVQHRETDGKLYYITLPGRRRRARRDRWRRRAPRRCWATRRSP